ncbi:MAG: hypothetical protein V2B20_09525 [Pseudomonadota bacterium]
MMFLINIKDCFQLQLDSLKGEYSTFYSNTFQIKIQGSAEIIHSLMVF